MSDKASNKQTIIFIILGFTIVFAVFLAVLRVLWTLYNAKEGGGAGSNSVPLSMLLNCFLLAVPAGFITLFILNAKRKVLEINSLVRFLSTVLVAMIAYWAIFTMYGFVIGDFNLVKHFAVLGAGIPVIGILAGAFLWQIRKSFGIKSL